MARVKVNGVEIEYEVPGAGKNPPMLLIMGLGAQLITWDDGFVDELVKRGFYVIRYDNRDSGVSTKMESDGPADIAATYAGARPPAYTLKDRAAGAAAWPDALPIRSAHIVGAPTVGFTTQLMHTLH